MLGILALTCRWASSGSIYAMLSHGLTTGGLFLGIGVLYERRHTRRLREYGGIWKQMPVFAGLFLVVVMGSAGLPALSGFVGEFFTLFGTFNAGDTFPTSQPHFLPEPRILAALATTGVILGAIYLLFMFQKVFFGKLDKARNGKLPDLRPHELMTFVVLVVGIIAMGLFPRPLLHYMEPSVEQFVGEFKTRSNECWPGEKPTNAQLDDAERCRTTAHPFGQRVPAPGEETPTAPAPEPAKAPPVVIDGTAPPSGGAAGRVRAPAVEGAKGATP